METSFGGRLLRNVYTHLPFCKKKCHFCAFPVHAIGNANLQLPTYMSHLEKQIKHTPYQLSNLSSFYIGGGTPSLYDPHQIHSLLQQFPLTPQTQVTLELNPSQIGKAEQFIEAGINRLSIGVQTFKKQLMELYNRGNSNYDELIEKVGAMENLNVNVDFILDFNSEEEEKKRMLEFVRVVKPKHITFYILEINEGSRLHQKPEKFKGTFGVYDYEEVSLQLKGLGYDHYQVSNFALPGYHSVHNRVYWEGDKQFAAFGMGASSLTNGYRVTRPPTLKKYYQYTESMPYDSDTWKKLAQIHEQNAYIRLKSIILSRIRRKEGFTWCQIQPHTSQKQIQKWKQLLASIHAENNHLINLEFLAQGVQLSPPKGYLVADEIAYRMLMKSPI